MKQSLQYLRGCSLVGIPAVKENSPFVGFPSNSEYIEFAKDKSSPPLLSLHLNDLNITLHLFHIVFQCTL